ncbi:MAG TPA: glycosyltransferase family 4 protein [Terriglobia bacterium]|nr:glycosyltransferase family 4 protein [Terriglobia bacterium]
MAKNSAGKIKIARIITRMDLGGAQQAVLHLSRGLDPQRFEQMVITGDGGLLLPDLSAIQTVEHYVIPELTRRIGPGGAVDDMRAVRRICAILRRFRPNVVHTHTPKAGIVGRWAARLARVPQIVHTYHGFGFSPRHPLWQKVFYVGLERATALITSQFVAVSDPNRALGQSYGIFLREKCALIRSGVEFCEFRTVRTDKSKKKIELGLKPSDKIVGVVASFTPAKALHLFLEASAKIAREVPGVSFVMVGDGSLRPALEAQAERLGISSSLRMLGWRRDVPELLRTFDVFLLTSLWEGLPRSLVEAFLCGVPAVASHVDGIGEIIQEGRNGFLVPANDTEAMAAAVVRLLKDELLRRTMGEQALNSVDDYSVEKMLKDYSNLYENISAAR